MSERGDLIKNWIKDRIERKETYRCMFDITVPKAMDMSYSNQYISEICKMFDKYGIKYVEIDTVPGDYNLDREWIETELNTPVECIVEFCGVYPINWDIEDVVRFEELERNGHVIIRVSWIQSDGKIVDNH